MIGFLSLADLGLKVAECLNRVPAGIDLVVGIPRSGMIPAYLIGLHRNLPILDLSCFLSGTTPAHGLRILENELSNATQSKWILLVDDSISTGRAMREAVEKVRASGYIGRITTCAVVAAPQRYKDVDIFFCEIPHPRLFEWNAFHHDLVEESCFDLDGVLCVDPTPTENDDGPRYRAFLKQAQPRFSPTRTIGNIVSARLEKYRDLTEKWLSDNRISYRNLHLIDLSSAAERIRTKAHSPHKAEVYRKSGASIFFESDPSQAEVIARLSAKPVICTQNMRLYLPGVSIRSVPKMVWWHLAMPIGRMRATMRSLRDGCTRVLVNK
jgi:uncharacterized HAD superfamily protein/hypoxanthine phosphoribosyltransferase